jgi:succinate dehydrogenase / fumarate reductase membrane anchor subunit
MSSKTNDRPIAEPRQLDNGPGQISWVFTRLSGLALLGLALFHLIYLHFIIPGGVSAIDYSTIASRWTNPASGFFWRFFDLLLLALALSHGATGVNAAINRSFASRNVRMTAIGGLVLAYLMLLTGSTWLIFTF